MSGTAIGCDPGTMFFQVARENETNEIVISTMRNAFVEVEATEDIEDTLKRNNWQYVRDGNQFYVIGEDSLKIAKMFPGKIELRRPMADGVLNKNEEKKMIVLSQMINQIVGHAPDDCSMICSCVSSQSVDESQDSSFHKARITSLFTILGWNVKVIEEGHAVILAERPTMIEPDGTESPFSGIGLSFGAGRCNAVLAYKGVEVVGMSCAKCLSKNFLFYAGGGVKKISEACIGDVIIDAKGKAFTIVNVIDNGVMEKLVSLKLKNLYNRFDMTTDHKVWVKKEREWQWINASDIFAGDVLGEPIVKYDGISRSFYYGIDARTKLPHSGERSRRLGRILGLFLGDGCAHISKNGLRNESNFLRWGIDEKNETVIDKYVSDISGYFGRDVSVDYYDHMANIVLHSNGIGRYFRKTFYNINGEKSFPFSLTEIPDQMAIGVVEGLLDSDGNVDYRGTGYNFTTTSMDLVRLMHQILCRFSIVHSVQMREPRLGEVNSKGVQIVGKKDTYEIRIPEFSSSLLNLYIQREGHGYPTNINDYMEYEVEDVAVIDYNDRVYDLVVSSPYHSFSSMGITVHNCGDWIDRKVAEQTGAPLSQITSAKERKLDFTNLDTSDDVLFSLNVYYDAMLEYVFKKFALKFKEVKSQFEAPIDVVVAGGTSLPKGFCHKISEVIKGLSLPFAVKEIRQSADPRNSVVKGCLMYAKIAQKRLEQEKKEDKNKKINEILG